MATPGPSEQFGSTVVRDPLIGAQLGEYKVLSILGEGSMGVVYRGEQPLIGKPVAIKVLQRALGSDPVYVQKLLDEARAISAARHPNIIDIFSFGQAPTGQQYFVMECLDGEPLDLHLRQQGALPPDEVARLLQQVTAGLSAAHAAGVVHRDLKPSNIFLARLGDGTRFVKLLDFGLAKRTAPNSGVRPTANMIVGTALYMAPEQATSDVIGPWTDLYAVGCIAHELLTGTVPFPGDNIIEVLGLHATATPTPLRQIDANIPEALEALVLELLQKVPDRRPKSAATVRKTLERIERQLANSRTRGSGIQQLTEPIAPTRISAPRQPPRREAEVSIPPTRISAPKLEGVGPRATEIAAAVRSSHLGPVPSSERDTRTSGTEPAQTGLDHPRRGSRAWFAVLLVPVLGVGVFLVAKQLDRPEPVAPVAARVPLPGPEPLGIAPAAEPAAPASPRPSPSPQAVKRSTPRADHGSKAAVEIKIREIRSRSVTLGHGIQRALGGLLDDCLTRLNAGAPPDEVMAEVERLETEYFVTR